MSNLPLTEKDLVMLYSQMIMNDNKASTIREWRKDYYAEDFSREPIWEGGSDIQLPIIFWVVELIHDRLVLSQFGTGAPSIHIKPKDLENTDYAVGMEHILDWVYKKTRKIEPVSLAIRDALLLGAGVCRVGEEDGLPVTEYIPLENFYVDAPYSAKQNAVCREFYLKRGELINMAKRRKLDVPVEVIEDLSETPEENVLRREYELPITQSAFPSVYNTIKVIEIFYRYDNIIYQALLAADKLLLHKRTRLDRFPYFVLRFHPHAWGTGLAPVLKPLSDELSVLHNQRIDNNTLVNLPILMVLSSSPAVRDKDTWFAGKKVIVDSPQDITPLTIAEKITGYQDEMQMFDYIKLISGTSELLSGAAIRGEKTAYEIEAILAEGSVRFRRYTRFLANWMEDMALFELKILRKNGKLSYRLLGFNVFDFVDDLEYNFSLSAQTILTNKELERQKWLIVRNILSQEPSVIGSPDRWFEVLRQLLVAYDIDYTKIIGEKPMEPVEPEVTLPPAGLGALENSELPPDALLALLGEMKEGGA